MFWGDSLWHSESHLLLVLQLGLINRVLHGAATRPVKILVGITLQYDKRMQKANASQINVIYERQFMLFLILGVSRSYVNFPQLCFPRVLCFQVCQSHSDIVNLGGHIQRVSSGKQLRIFCSLFEDDWVIILRIRLFPFQLFCLKV